MAAIGHFIALVRAGGSYDTRSIVTLSWATDRPGCEMEARNTMAVNMGSVLEWRVSSGDNARACRASGCPKTMTLQIWEGSFTGTNV
jgi:hypothetical protein